MAHVATEQTVILSQAGEFFPRMAHLLPSLNEALRNINFGKMDHLPFYDEVSGYQVAMRAPLLPQGTERPPAIGHWQVEISRDDKPWVLLLQGKSQSGEETGRLVFLCDDPNPPTEG